MYCSFYMFNMCSPYVDNIPEYKYLFSQFENIYSAVITTTPSPSPMAVEIIE